MRVADMSDVRCPAVECFSTGCASKRTFGSLFVARFQVTIEMRFLGEAFVAAGTFVRFLPGMHTLVSDKMIWPSKCFPVDVAPMFLPLSLGCGFTIPRLNSLQLVNMT